MSKEILNFLKILKAYGLKNDIPNITERNGRFLNMLIKISGSKNVLEIGCANGYSTIWLADAVCQNKGKIISIDFSRPSLHQAKVNLEKVGLSNIVDFYFDDALKRISKIKSPKKFDFVFVDGQKKQYWDFWLAIRGRLSDKAVVVFDDVIAFANKTSDFMEKIKKVKGFEQVVLPVDENDGVLVIRKNI